MSQKINLSLDEVESRLSAFSFPRIDFVIGIATGGVHPAKMISKILNKPMGIIEINFRSQDNNPLYDKPQLIRKDKIPAGNNRLLLVDDVSVSGKTIDLAKKVFSDYQIITFVLKGKADLVLFPEIISCVSWPWIHSSRST